jgi:exopolysaccharide biosynthesis polyprenyl glycosylphosphotransferase
MRVKDTSDVLASCLAIAADALAVFAGFMLATWIRFDSGLIPLFHDRPPPHLYGLYSQGAAIGTLLFLFIFQSLRLYVRPQIGTFGDKIPRLIHGIGLGLLLALALAFAIRTEPPFSRLTALLAAGTISLCVLLERYFMFEWEKRLARRRKAVNRVLIVGTDSIAARLRQALRREPRLGSQVVAFLSTREAPAHPEIPAELIKGTLDQLPAILAAGGVDQVILTDPSIGHPRMIAMILECEQALATFNLVPDLFRVLTDAVDMQTIDDIPLLGVSRWPLDHFWNRVLKRGEDVVGSALGLVLLAPFMALVALLIRRDSPGPVFYSQERCGENGAPFVLVKFRTMRADAEAGTGPVWAEENDPRRTRIGAFLRRHNLDELPQLWNVLKGEMSLVGPRPERPCFVEQFKEDISRYMWRHVSKPGITGWAQINGWRGNTDLQERVKYDLYYLENWSLAFDFKIIVKTFFRRKNAY